MFGSKRYNNVHNPQMGIGRAMTRAFLVNLAGSLGTMAAFAALGKVVVYSQEKKNEE